MISIGKYKYINKNSSSLKITANKPNQFHINKNGNHENNSFKAPKYVFSSQSKTFKHVNTPIKSKVSKFKLVKNPENPNIGIAIDSKSLYKVDYRYKAKMKRNKMRSGVFKRQNFRFRLSRLVSEQKLKQDSIFKMIAVRCRTNKSISQNPYQLDRRSFKFTKSDNKCQSDTKFKLNNKLINNVVASGLLQRSIMTIHRKNSKLKTSNDSKSENEKYCKFFNLFGKCSRGDSCKYRHDSNRIAVCARFLKGTCEVDSCPYSHKVNPEKVPLCLFFTFGCCNRDNCPYLHVFHGKDAQFCEDFAKGYCKNAEKCDKAHLKICPDYVKTKSCPRGNKCPLMHQKLRIKNNLNSNRANTELNSTNKSCTQSINNQFPDEVSDQSFISLKKYSSNNQNQNESPIRATKSQKEAEPLNQLKIKPNLRKKTAN